MASNNIIINELTNSNDSLIIMMNNNSEDCASNYTYYKMESTVMLGFIALPISVFGLLANLLSVRIFTHPIMISSPINWYLAVLSTSDFFIVICFFCTHCLPRLSEFWQQLYVGYRVSMYVTPVTYPTAPMAQTISVYMTILMSAHRFIGVCFPFRAAEILKKSRVKTAIITLVSLAILFNFTRLFEVYAVRCWADRIQDWTVLLKTTQLRDSVVYQWIFMGFGQTIIMFIIPFVLLIVLNSQIIRAVHQTRRQHSRIQTDDREKRAELAKEISTSVMLVGIVVVFLACNSLAFVINIIECARLMSTDQTPFSTFVSISNLLINVNASINIAVYCLFSEKYRALLRHYTLCHCWFREGDFLVSSLN